MASEKVTQLIEDVKGLTVLELADFNSFMSNSSRNLNQQHLSSIYCRYTTP